MGGILDDSQLNHGALQFIGLDALALDLVAEQIGELDQVEQRQVLGAIHFALERPIEAGEVVLQGLEFVLLGV